ncbi:hypothetical protein K3495_g11550 [Podosphaera aphanis]|nr:hypothetical protein K3495_g11550 [Podosphaera aphanis]
MSTAEPEMSDISDSQHAYNEFEDFGDIFGSAPGSPVIIGAKKAEYSDIPRIKKLHETAGYREGITQGKGMSVQRGFDEGFGLGALIGLHAGRILGTLEGIREGSMRAKNHRSEEEIQRIWQLSQQAEQELALQRIFSDEWWTTDGIWSYTVAVVRGDRDADHTVTFEDVAREHPVLKRWEVVAGNESRRWNLNLKIFGTNSSEVVAEAECVADS